MISIGMFDGITPVQYALLSEEAPHKVVIDVMTVEITA